MFSPPIAASSEGIHYLSHWGILVNEMSMIDLTVILSRTMRLHARENTEFGIMYELYQGENHVNNVRITKDFGMNLIRNEWRMFSMQYVGKTTMTHDEIKGEAIRIIDTHPDYRLFENNCQNFAKYLLETICPDASIPKTIADVLQGLWNIASLAPLETLPGAYPCSLSSADNDSFETASGTYWFSTTETSWITAVDYLMSVKEDDGISAISHPMNQDIQLRRSVGSRGLAAIQRRFIGRTALIKAARNGDIKRVKTLLDLKVDIKIKGKYGMTALHYAAERGHKDVVALLLSHGADVAAKDDLGYTALHWAARNGHKDVVALLPGHMDRADVAEKDRFQTTALHCAAGHGHRDVVALLLEHGADAAAKDRWQMTALHEAAWNGHQDVVALLLERNPDLIAAKDEDGSTALHGAAVNGHKDVVALLLEHMDKADVAAKDKYGETALHGAAVNGHADAVALLWVRNPDLIAAKDVLGRTALHGAAWKGHADVVALLLDKMDRAGVAAKDNYQSTALHRAAEDGHKDAVALLLAKMDRADVAARDFLSQTAMHRAAVWGHKDVVALLEKWERDHQDH